MGRDKLDYGRLVEAALRTVVKDVIAQFGDDKIPPPHHYYITFNTQHPLVEMSDYLHQRYPTEMTIVLQHQFWDLSVDDDFLRVTLSFNDQPEPLIIPLKAIKVFADPAVDFGLQFSLDVEGKDDRLVSLPAPIAKPVAERTSEEVEDKAPESEAATDEKDGKGVPEGGAEIVTLDRFRRK